MPWRPCGPTACRPCWPSGRRVALGASGFGVPGAPPEDGEWDFALQAVADPDRPLAITYDVGKGEVAMGHAGGALVTVTLTLTGVPAFCEALRGSFGLED
jgi:hypothetical protein